MASGMASSAFGAKKVKRSGPHSVAADGSPGRAHREDEDGAAQSAEHAGPAAILGPSSSPGVVHVPQPQTIITTGPGDLAPAMDIGRLVAVSEARDSAVPPRHIRHARHVRRAHRVRFAPAATHIGRLGRLPPPVRETGPMRTRPAQLAEPDRLDAPRKTHPTRAGPPNRACSDACGRAQRIPRFPLILTVFGYLAADTPSLLPRPWYFQGLISGILALIFYAVGLAISSAVRAIGRWADFRMSVNPGERSGSRASSFSSCSPSGRSSTLC